MAGLSAAEDICRSTRVAVAGDSPELLAVAAGRKTPRVPAYQHLLFVTKYGGPWYSPSGSACPIAQEFRKLTTQLGIYRRGLGFYALRHTFETVAGETLDQVAVNHIMGHADNSMAATYRESISDDRLRAAAEHVHTWLFDSKEVRP